MAEEDQSDHLKTVLPLLTASVTGAEPHVVEGGYDPPLGNFVHVSSVNLTHDRLFRVGCNIKPGDAKFRILLFSPQGNVILDKGDCLTEHDEPVASCDVR